MKTQDMKFFTIIILLGLNLFTALLLQSNLTTNYVLPLVAILIGIIITAGIIFGMWIEENWAYPITTIVFALSLINITWLFYQTETFLIFAFGLLVNVSGLVICLVGMENQANWHELETYEIKNKKKKK